MKRIHGEQIFSLILLLIFGVFFFMAFSYNPTARFFPAVFGVVGMVFTLQQFIAPMMKREPGLMTAVAPQEESDHSADGAEETTDIAWFQYFKLILWVAFFTLLIWIIGYAWATFLFLVLFLRFAGGAKWITTLLYAAIFSGSLYIIFGYLMV